MIADCNDKSAEGQEIEPHAAEQPKDGEKADLPCAGAQHHAEHQKYRQQPKQTVLQLHLKGLMVQGVAKYPQSIVQQTHAAPHKNRQQEQTRLYM